MIFFGNIYSAIVGEHSSESVKVNCSENKVNDAALEGFELIGSKKNDSMPLCFSCEIASLKKQLTSLENKTTKEKILTFCYSLIAEKKSAKVTHENLGKIIYLTDVDANKLAELMDADDCKSSIDRINDWCSEEFMVISNDFAALAKIYENDKFQDAKSVYAAQRPIAVAKLLITSSENFNTGMIYPLLESLNLKNGTSSDEIYLANQLIKLYSKPSLREEICSTVKPELPGNEMDSIIRYMLNLHAHEIISDRHAIIVNLATQLTELSQNTGSLAKLIQDERPRWLTRDIRMLVEKGALKQLSGTEKEAFSYTAQIADRDCSKSVWVTRNGTFKGTKNYFNQSPGIVAACALGMGICSADKEISKKALSYLFCKTSNPYLKVNPNNIIEAYAKTVSTDEQTAEKLTRQGLLAFSAQTNGILLKVWENVLASMEAVSQNDYARTSRLYEGIKLNLKFLIALKHLRSADQPFYKKFMGGFKQTFLDYFIYKYHPNVQEGGAFALYAKTPDGSLKHWKKINSAEAFRSHLLIAFDAIPLINELKQQPSVKTQLIDEVRNFIMGDQFINRFYISYSLAEINNGPIDNELLELADQNTPWLIS